MIKRFPWFVALALSALLPAGVSAQVQCASLTNPVYLQVGDTQEPLMKALARKLRDEPEPITLVYVTSGSCTNVEAIYTGVPITRSGVYVPSTAEDPAWQTSLPGTSCSMPTEGTPVDVANSALFVSSCNADEPPAGVALFQGPVQGYGFIVPKASSQRALTAEEGYFTFGFGNQGQVTPWNDEAFMFIRTTTKSTLLTLAAILNVPAKQWRGQMLDKSSEVLSGVIASTEPEKTIGLLGVELFDKSRDKVKLLAFRAYGQRYAYYPDSTSTSFDKRNVRDGHYVPWSPTVWLTKVGGDGRALNPRAGRVIDLILGNEVEPAPHFEPLDVVVGVGLVPECAMSVTRAYEAGPLSRYEPEQPCGCYYDKVATGTAPASCVACDEASPCASGVCRHGFCEVR